MSSLVGVDTVELTPIFPIADFNILLSHPLPFSNAFIHRCAVHVSTMAPHIDKRCIVLFRGVGRTNICAKNNLIIPVHCVSCGCFTAHIRFCPTDDNSIDRIDGASYVFQNDFQVGLVKCAVTAFLYKHVVRFRRKCTHDLIPIRSLAHSITFELGFPCYLKRIENRIRLLECVYDRYTQLAAFAD